MYNYNDLADKTVLVTGASGDIGLAICTKFLEQKCIVFAVYNWVFPDHGGRLRSPCLTCRNGTSQLL